MVPAALIAGIAAYTCLTTTGARPSDTSSSSSRLGVGHQRTADGQCLLLAARQPAAGRLQQPAEQRERLEHRSLFHGPVRRRWAPMSRFSSTVSDGKMRRPSGTSEMPRRTRSCAGTAVERLAVVADAAARRREPVRRSS